MSGAGRPRIRGRRRRPTECIGVTRRDRTPVRAEAGERQTLRIGGRLAIAVGRPGRLDEIFVVDPASAESRPIELARLRRDAGRRPIDDGRAARVSEENVLQRHALGFLSWPGRAGRTADEAPATLPAPRLPGKSRTSRPALACASDGVCDKRRTAPSGALAPRSLVRYLPALAQALRRLGDSSTVELRTLTPSILVRIQVPQPSNRLKYADLILCVTDAPRWVATASRIGDRVRRLFCDALCASPRLFGRRRRPPRRRTEAARRADGRVRALRS